MGGFVKMLFIFIVIVFLALWLYLSKYATKADVFARERSYNIKLPLWMREMPKMTGDIQDTFSAGRAAVTGEFADLKNNAKEEFNKRMEDVRNEAKEKAKQEANKWIEKQFTSGTGN